MSQSKTINSKQLLLTVPQAAKVLQVSPRTVAYLLDEGKLRSVKIGAARRISVEAVKSLAATGATLSSLAARALAQSLQVSA